MIASQSKTNIEIVYIWNENHDSVLIMHHNFDSGEISFYGGSEIKQVARIIWNENARDNWICHPQILLTYGENTEIINSRGKILYLKEILKEYDLEL